MRPIRLRSSLKLPQIQSQSPFSRPRGSLRDDHDPKQRQNPVRRIIRSYDQHR